MLLAKIDKLEYWDKTLTKYRESPIKCTVNNNQIIVYSKDFFDVNLSTFKHLKKIWVSLANYSLEEFFVTSVLANEEVVVISTSNHRETE